MRLGVLYLGRVGGISHYTAHLARALDPLTEVTLYLSSHNDQLALYRGLSATLTTTPTYRGRREFLRSMIGARGPARLARRIARDAPDVLLDTGAGPWAGPIKRRLPPWILLADVVHDPRGHPDRGYWPSRLEHAIYPRRAAVYVGLSAATHRQLCADHPSAVHLESRHGPILTGGGARPEDAAKRSQNILFFGRIERYKGVEVLIDAFGRAKRQVPALRLSVLGRGRIGWRARRAMDRLGVRVVNRWIADDELVEEIDAHGLIVAPYTSATQSGVVAAAMARGRPCLATTTGGLPEQIRHGESGWLVPPGDAGALAEALVDLCGDPARLASMAHRSYALGRTTFAWSTIASELVAGLRATLGHTEGGPQGA